MKKRQDGFTLIELIVVIIVLGILAAYAIPKYMALDQNARISVVQGLTGSIRAAADIVHTIAITKNASGTVNTGSINIAIERSKYPTAAVNGINAAIQDTSGFNFTGGGITATYTKTGAPTEANCSIIYDPSTIPPTVTPNYNGC